jgi:ATP-dependent Clp protease ATP-binding subunit ClpC
MHQRFTEQARLAVTGAQADARALGTSQVGTEHLLLGLMSVPDSSAATALSSLGLTRQAVRAQVIEVSGQAHQAGPAARSGYTERADNVLQLSVREALRLGDNHVGTGHILLALSREPGARAADVLARLGINPAQVRRQVTMLAHRPAPGPVSDREAVTDGGRDGSPAI